MSQSLANVQSVTNHLVAFTDASANATGGFVLLIDPDAATTNQFAALFTGTNWVAAIVNILTNDWQDCRFNACVTNLNPADKSPMSYSYFVTPLLTNETYYAAIDSQQPFFVLAWPKGNRFWKLNPTNGLVQFSMVMPAEWLNFTPLTTAPSKASQIKQWIVNQYAQ